MPLVDVIIPTWNCENYILRAIESVLKQQFEDYSLIIVDDGSTDGSEEKIRSAMDQDPRIIYIQQENGGAGLARNNGVDHGKSKYVLFLDADDEITPSCLRVLTDNLEQTENDFCIGRKLKFTHGTNELYYPEMFSRDIRTVKAKEIPQIRYHIAPHAKMIRREFMDRIKLRFPVGVTYEDFVFSYELLLKSSSAGVCSTLCYLHHVSDISISQKIHNEFNIISRWIVEAKLWELCAELDENRSIYGDSKAFSMNSRFWGHVSTLGNSEDNVNAFLVWKDLVSSNSALINFADLKKARLYKNIIDMSFFEFMSYTYKSRRELIK